jgi:hypothetical protein
MKLKRRAGRFPQGGYDLLERILKARLAEIQVSEFLNSMIKATEMVGGGGSSKSAKSDSTVKVEER